MYCPVLKLRFREGFCRYFRGVSHTAASDPFSFLIWDSFWGECLLFLTILNWSASKLHFRDWH